MNRQKEELYREKEMLSYLVKLVGTSIFVTLIVIYVSNHSHAALHGAMGVIAG